MARPLRIEHPGAIWHVTSRGNARQDIALDDIDRVRFIATLGCVAPTMRWRLHAWVLMSNHHHLLVETPDANLARGMRQLNGIYSQAFNRRHERVGHLFQGRYKGILVEREGHLLELVRYVVLNPVRAGMVRTPAEHRWSSYAETAGFREAADWLEVDWTLSQFGSRRDEARRRFREFVSEGRSQAYRPWEELRGRVWLGSKRFVELLGERSRDATLSPEVPRAQRSIRRRPDLEAVKIEVRRAFGAGEAHMVSGSGHPARKAFALLARRVADALQAEIAQPLGLAPRSVSSLLHAAEALEGRDPVFARQVRECQQRLLRPDSVADHHSET
jgi:putative transposase